MGSGMKPSLFVPPPAFANAYTHTPDSKPDVHPDPNLDPDSDPDPNPDAKPDPDPDRPSPATTAHSALPEAGDFELGIALIRSNSKPPTFVHLCAAGGSGDVGDRVCPHLV